MTHVSRAASLVAVLLAGCLSQEVGEPSDEDFETDSSVDDGGDIDASLQGQVADDLEIALAGPEVGMLAGGSNQLLANPGFETTPFVYGQWELRGAPALTRWTSGAAYAGSYGIRITATGTDKAYVIQCQAGTPGRLYLATANTSRVAGEGHGRQRLFVAFWIRTSGGLYFDANSGAIAPDSTDWAFVSRARTAPANTERVCVAFGAPVLEGVSKRRWDEISLHGY